MKLSSIFKATILLVLGAMLVSCTAQPVATKTPEPTKSPSATPTAAPSATMISPPLPEGKIIFQKADGKKFAGTIYGRGKTALILTNMGTGGATKWSPLVDAVDKEKFTVITFNYLQTANAATETKLVFEKVRASYSKVICIGASLGVQACAGLTKEPEIIGMAFVAGQNISGDLIRVTYPKLFIVGENDTQFVASMKSTFESADEPKKLIVYTGNAMHGSDLFYSTDSEDFLKQLLDFVNGLP